MKPCKNIDDLDYGSLYEVFDALDSLNSRIVESMDFDFSGEVAKLIDKYPERFAGIDAENLAKPKSVSIDYADGCAYIDFDTGRDEDDPLADLTGNSTNMLELPEYKDLMKEVFDGKVDEWLKEHGLSHKDLCGLRYDPGEDENAVFLEFDVRDAAPALTEASKD